ncbi:retrovirus-related Pol polyprotein from type-1 retrotransposable element R2 [Trichonephila clavipes]|nr:retrovirus-related Pol polyprotein from type-1 retrotransposable element R2 [Trichonephila clavipes]
MRKMDWEQVDSAARREVKNILSLPSNAANHYIYGSRKLGCCGLPSAAEDSDFYLVDSAFKLLTSRDEEVALQAMGQFTRTVIHRIGRTPTDGDRASYLSVCMEEDYATTTNQLSNNTWTRARMASTRQQVTWSFTEGKPSISFEMNSSPARTGEECFARSTNTSRMWRPRSLWPLPLKERRWTVWLFWPIDALFKIN